MSQPNRDSGEEALPHLFNRNGGLHGNNMGITVKLGGGGSSMYPLAHS